MAIEQIPQATIDKPKEITVSIPEDLLRELKWLSDILQVSPSIALRHAIATDSYIQSELKKQSKFLVEKKDGSRREISWADSKEIVKILNALES
jgi:metal-responsive CopG/Arc/MetJ family transcriptional regulator